MSTDDDRVPDFDALEFLYIQEPEDKFWWSPSYAFLLSNSYITDGGLITKSALSWTPQPREFRLQKLHEVSPGLGYCTDFARINDELLYASFKDGSLVTVKKFGPGKTFDCDVRARLKHPVGIARLAKNSDCSMLAAGGQDCTFSLYDVNAEKATLTQKGSINDAHTSNLIDIQFCLSDHVHKDRESHTGESDDLLGIGSKDGIVKLWDTRILGAASITINSNITLTSFARLDGSTNIVIGTSTGYCLIYDLKYPQVPQMRVKLSKFNITRIRQVAIKMISEVVYHCLVISDGTNNLLFRNPRTLVDLSHDWQRMKEIEHPVRDFKYVNTPISGDLIFACGESSELGIWKFHMPRSHRVSPVPPSEEQVE